MHQKETSELEITVKEALEQAKEKGYQEGKSERKRIIRYYLDTYKNDAGLRGRLEMYLADEND